MSTKSHQNKNHEEIDLAEISKKIGVFFEDIIIKLFKGILFLKRNILWLGILFILGAAIGFYFDTTKKMYDSEIIVSPNYGSTDYLYSKIALIQSKIDDNDTVFLKEVVGLQMPKKLKSIKVEPIADVYKFIGEKDERFQLIKLLAEDGDINKILKEKLTSKNYPYHLITVKTLKQTTDRKTIQPLLKYLNNSEYYNLMMKDHLSNVKIKMVENDSIISQINGFLNAFSNTVNGSQKSDKLVYYNENSQLNEVIKTKDMLITEQGKLRTGFIELNKVIKENSVTLNLKNKKTINGKMKFILPFLFVFMFILIGFFSSYYKKQMEKLKN